MVVKLAGSEPLRKARVQLRSFDDPTRTISAVTGPDGRFHLRGIEPGRYKVQVSRNGFVSQEYGQRKPNDPGAILALQAGQEIKDLLFRLIPAAIITGRILDEDGEPLAQVMVSAVREIYFEGKRTLATSSAVSTDDLGAYRLYGLPPGRYFVTAVYPQWSRYAGNGDDSDEAEPQQQGYARMFYPGTSEPAKAIPLAIKSGEETSSIEILMRHVRVYHVRGHAFNLVTRKPGGNANVMLMAKNRRVEWDFGEHQAMVQKNDGAFDISDVLPGSYVLTAFWFDEGKPFLARTPVEVGNTDVDGITLTLGAGVSITGRIIWDGQPSLDGELSVMPKPADTGPNFWGSETRVDSGNSFTLKDVGDGTYFAEISGQSKDCYIKDVHYGPANALEEGFLVTRGAIANLEITISSHGARLQGAVADVDGLPATGVHVALVPEEPRRGLHRLFKSGTTDQYGRFELRGIAPGDYKLFSWEDVESDAWEDPEFLKPFEEKGEKVSMQGGDQKSVNLTAIRTKAADSPRP